MSLLLSDTSASLGGVGGGGGGTPGATFGSVQYNNAGTFAGATFMGVTAGTGLYIDLENNDYHNVNGADCHIMMNNLTGSQNVVGSYFGSTLAAKWRTDNIGNVNWCAVRSHIFYIGGDGGDGFPDYFVINDGGNGNLTTHVVCNRASTVGMRISGFASQTGNYLEFQDATPTVVSSFDKNGAWNPPSLADATAVNNSVYYSTNANKLVYKDSGGVVNALY